MKNENETPEARKSREQMQSIAVGLAAGIKGTLQGTKLGFSLVLFDFHDADMQNMAYAADGNRLDLIKMYRELADKLEIDQQAKRIDVTRRSS